jgi:hypothetical protein
MIRSLSTAVRCVGVFVAVALLLSPCVGVMVAYAEIVRVETPKLWAPYAAVAQPPHVAIYGVSDAQKMPDEEACKEALPIFAMSLAMRGADVIDAICSDGTVDDAVEKFKQRALERHEQSKPDSPQNKKRDI